MGNATGFGHNDDSNDYASILSSFKSAVETGETQERTVRLDARGKRLSRPDLLL